MKKHLRNRTIYQRCSNLTLKARNRNRESRKIWVMTGPYDRVIATMAVLFILVAGVFAQGVAQSTISGRITDTRGSVVGGAQITVTSGNRTIGTTSTTDDGRFTIDLAPGDYELRAT